MKKQQPAKDSDETLPFEATQAAAAMMEREPCSPALVDLDSQESVATPEGSCATPVHAPGFCRSLAHEFSMAKRGGLTKFLEHVQFNRRVIFFKSTSKKVPAGDSGQDVSAASAVADPRQEPLVAEQPPADPCPKAPSPTPAPRERAPVLIVPQGWETPIHQKMVDIFVQAKTKVSQQVPLEISGHPEADRAPEVPEPEVPALSVPEPECRLQAETGAEVIDDDEGDQEPPVTMRVDQWELKPKSSKGRGAGKGRGRGRGRGRGADQVVPGDQADGGDEADGGDQVDLVKSSGEEEEHNVDDVKPKPKTTRRKRTAVEAKAKAKAKSSRSRKRSVAAEPCAETSAAGDEVAEERVGVQV